MITIDFLLNGDEAPIFRAKRLESGIVILTAENERHGDQRVVLHLDAEQAQAIADALLKSLYPALETSQ